MKLSEARERRFEDFRRWLRAQSQLSPRTKGDADSRARRVERDLFGGVNLDTEYTQDRLARVLQALEYTAEDVHNHREPPEGIIFHFNPDEPRYYERVKDVLNGLYRAVVMYREFATTYKAAVGKYVVYKDAEETVQGTPTFPQKVPPRVDAKVPNAVKSKVNIDDEFKKTIQRFGKWLIEEAGLKKNSANQYKTYIKKLRSAVDEQFGLGWFELLLLEYLKDLSEGKLIQCSAYIEDSIRNSPKSGRKAWNDWRSAFHGFEEFLHDIADVYNWDAETLGEELVKEPETKRRKIKPSKPTSEKEDGKNDAVIATYTHPELARAFMGRLKTQSRYYPKSGLLFPTRLLTKIFRHSKRNIWIEWLRSDLKDMLILAEGGLKMSFSEVKQFEFHGDGTVLITKSDGATVIMMTHTADGKDIIIEQAKRGLRDVSIDHVKSLEGVLRRNKNRLSGLRRITELFFEFEKSVGFKLNPRAEKDWANDFYDQFRPVLDTDDMRSLIAEDLNILDLEYELMDTTYNTIKGKRA